MANESPAKTAPTPLVVRSIEVPVGAEAPFMALFLADTHLTLCDAHDNGRKNALAAARLQGEFRDAERFLRKALAWAHERHPALLLHAGDLIDFTKTVGPVKPVHSTGQGPLLPGQAPDFSMFRYLKEAGVPYARLHDVGGRFGGSLYVDIPNIFREFDADDALSPFALKRKGPPVLPPDWRKHIHAISDYHWSVAFTRLFLEGPQ